MRKISGIIIAVVFALSSTFAMAGNTKIGVVDLQKIMQTSPHMKEIQAELEKRFKPRRDVLVAMEDSLKKDMEAFKRDSTVLSAAKRKDQEAKIVEAQQKFERDGQQYQQELSAANNEAMEGFYNKIRVAISKVAETEKYDLVFQKDAAPFSVESLDVTAKVMKEIM
ncbi:MAG: OmpH family outer membrane protein [Legionellaceae bacterium]|nr:OmpH family outer membrane protein [Legionellaceae bacterium]